MAYLRLYLGDALQRQWQIDSDLISIGRAETNDVVLESKGISKHHAIITRKHNNFYIIDQKSANGVYVNGEKITSHKLQYWDEIQIFEYVLKYMASARLPGEQQKAELFLDSGFRYDPTREFKISNTKGVR